MPIDQITCDHDKNYGREINYGEEYKDGLGVKRHAVFIKCGRCFKTLNVSNEQINKGVPYNPSDMTGMVSPLNC